MILAYLSGTKYIVVFNYPKIEGNDYGIMTDEHFDALKRFWNYVKNHLLHEIYGPEPKRIAYVLPKDYGWAFRGSRDKVWGL